MFSDKFFCCLKDTCAEPADFCAGPGECRGIIGETAENRVYVGQSGSVEQTLLVGHPFAARRQRRVGVLHRRDP